MEADEQRRTYDWRPSKAEALIWNAQAVLLLVLGLVIFGLPVFVRSARGLTGVAVTISITSLVSLGIVLGVTVGLFCMHEGIHALVMRLFGARPGFGMAVVAGAFPALYTT